MHGVNMFSFARRAVFLRPARDDLPQFFGVGDQDVRAPDHLHRERSIDHVTAGEAKVEPPARRVVDLLGDGGGEADNVVVEGFLQFFLAFDEFGWMAVEIFRTRFDPLEVGPGNDAFGNQRFAGEEFDLQPDFEFVFVGPDGPHRGTRIPLNHGLRVKGPEPRVECRVSRLRLRSAEWWPGGGGTGYVLFLQPRHCLDRRSLRGAAILHVR